MVARLCLIFSILFAGDSTLPNGIRVYELSDTGNTNNSFELIAGYRTGTSGEIAGARGLAEVIAAFLKSSASARTMAVAAYGSGGEIEFIQEPDRTGIHLKMPRWAKPMVENSIAEFLSETPQKNPELVDRALDDVRFRNGSHSGARLEVEERLRNALMGPGAKADLTGVTREKVIEYFANNYGTDRAFVVMNTAHPAALQLVERRTSVERAVKIEGPPALAMPRPPDAALRVASDLDEGAVILGVPTPSIYYRNWYALLMLDRLIQDSVPQKPRTELLPTLEPYYYKLEAAVPPGQLPETVGAALQRELEQMQFVPAAIDQMGKARRSALQYLESDAVQQWFVSQGVPERRLEGLNWIQSFTSDDMRAAARDVVAFHPLVASWAPRVRELKLVTEKLSDISENATNSLNASSPKPAPPPVKTTPFPSHADAPYTRQVPVILNSGVSLVAGSKYAVFVAPDSPDSLTIYDQEPDLDQISAAYGMVRSNRILVMAPAESLDRVRQQWASFKGNPKDETVVTIKGNIPGPYLPTLLVLKMMLDRRLIEAGLWMDVQLEIRASKGSTLTIYGNDADRRLVLGWIDEIATRPIPEEDVEWAREAAIHHLPTLRPDLQSLIWEWVPNDFIPDMHHLPTSLIQFVARTYLQ